MRQMRSLIIIPAILFAAACGRDESPKSVVAALDNDLRLAGDAYAPGIDSISMLERNAALAATARTSAAAGAHDHYTTAYDVDAPRFERNLFGPGAAAHEDGQKHRT